MPRRVAAARWPSAEWAIRGVLAFIAAAVGYYSVSFTLGYVLKANPAQAHVLAPHDGRITARLAQELMTARTTEVARREATRLAHLALKQDPTAVRAVIALGLAAELRGDSTSARRLLAYAEALSRRELQTQLWAIEDAVARNDIPGALKNYDIALRTSRAAADLLFPVLAPAVADPAIRSALVSVLAAKPTWGPGFIGYVVSHSPGPLETSDFLLRLGRAGVSVTEEVSAAAINALIAGGFPDRAWSYYALLRPGAARNMSRDPRFTAEVNYPLPFDWVSLNDAGVSASIQRGRNGGIFEFSAPPSVGGPLLQQMQMLPPGDYSLEGHSIGLDQAEGSHPYWVLRCHGGRELGRVAVPDSTQNNGVFAGRFSVPAGCPVQTLVLIARPSDSASGLAGQMDEVRLISVH